MGIGHHSGFQASGAPTPAGPPVLHAASLGAGGVPLLLLHGIGGAGSSWMPVAARLASQRRVLVPDLLGFGQSPWPDTAYTLEEHVAAVDRLLQDRGLGDGPLDVAGHSLGAIVAAELASRTPRMRHLTLVSLPYFTTEEEARRTIGNAGLLARLTVMGHWAAGAVCDVMCALRPQLRFLAPHFAPHVPAEVARDSLMHNYRSYSRTLENVVVRHRLDLALGRLTDRHVTFVHGNADRTAPLGDVQALAKQYSRWRVEVVAAADHHLPILRPELLARLLSEPIAQVSPAG